MKGIFEMINACGIEFEPGSPCLQKNEMYCEICSHFLTKHIQLGASYNPRFEGTGFANGDRIVVLEKTGGAKKCFFLKPESLAVLAKTASDSGSKKHDFLKPESLAVLRLKTAID